MNRPGKLEIGPYTYYFPMSWLDFNRRELIRLFEIINRHGKTPFYNLFLITHCLGFTRLQSWFKKRVKYLIKKTPADVKITLVHNEEILGWLEKTKKNPMPYMLKWFWHRGRLYVGPHKRLNKLNVSEMTFAMYYYQQYHKTKNEKVAEYLIDVLYRPVSIKKLFKRVFSENPEADIRVNLNDYMHHKRAKRFSTLKPAIKAIIIAQWAVAQGDFAKKYKMAFRGTSKQGNSRDMAKFIIGAAGDKFGTVAQAETASADKVFEYVEMQLEQMEARKK